jgi:muramoyltetrapeptide carboxypeptidase
MSYNNDIAYFYSIKKPAYKFMNTIIKPPMLKKGDIIGIVAPSRHIHEFKLQIEASVFLLKKMGFKIVFGKNFKKKLSASAGTAKERAADFQEMFERKDVSAIFCALGGDSANQLLPLIDYKLIKKNPKIILGSSDITNLLLAINKKTSLMTFHGPNIKDFGRISKKSLTFLLDLLELKNRKKIIFPGKMSVIKSGRASGKLIGGNLLIINSLLATEYVPNLKGSVLFWEELEDDISDIEFELTQLKLSGVLNQISGMIVGNIKENPSTKKRELEIVFKELACGIDIPIIKVDYFGHGVKDFFTFPIGANATLDTKNKIFSVSL